MSCLSGTASGPARGLLAHIGVLEAARNRAIVFGQHSDQVLFVKRFGQVGVTPCQSAANLIDSPAAAGEHDDDGGAYRQNTCVA
jgi:hypothetical protein